MTLYMATQSCPYCDLIFTWHGDTWYAAHDGLVSMYERHLRDCRNAPARELVDERAEYFAEKEPA